MGKISMIVSPKTVYSDILSMPDPMLLGLTVHYYNHSDVTLYMQISSITSGAWTGTTVNLGSLATGANNYINLDNFASRTKPVAALTEVLTVTLKGYTDAGYTTLAYTFSRDVTMIFIKSDDGSWTTDYDDNFDDGTVDGWDTKKLGGAGSFVTATISVAADYVLSTPYSLKDTSTISGWTNDTRYLKYIEVINGTLNTTIVYCGKLPDDTMKHDIPINKWMRIVVPLPVNTTLELQIAYDSLDHLQGGGFIYWSKNAFYKSITTPNRPTVYAIINVRLGCLNSGGGGSILSYAYMWMDDFKVISK